MSNFTPLVTRTYTFEEDEITVQYTRLKRADMMKILPKARGLNIKEDDVADDVDMDESKASALFDIFDGIDTSKYIQSITGVKDADGNAVDKDVVMEEMYFMGLAFEILGDIFSDSTPEGKA